MLRLSNRQTRLLSAEEIDRAITKSDDMTKAARILGISSTRLYQLCQTHDIRTKSERKELTREQLRGVITHMLYCNDFVVAQHLGMSSDRLRLLCREYNLLTPNRHIRARHGRVTLCRLEEVCAKYPTTAEAIRAFGMHQTRFHNLCKRYGIKTPYQRHGRKDRDGQNSV